MTKISNDNLLLAARLTGCRPQEILSLRITEDGGLVVIAPSGQKLTYSPEQVMEAHEEAAEEKPSARPQRAACRRRSP